MDHSVKTPVLSVKMWPPSKSTRLMLVDRMTKNITTPSIFSRKYGLLTQQEAEKEAKRIEDLAFSAANKHFQNEPDGDGTSAVHLYAKESSKLMLEVIKRGPQEIESEAANTTGDGDSLFDLSGGRRAFIEEDEARELLRPLTDPQQRNSFTKIRFSNRSFGLEAAKLAVTVLSSIKDQLTEVDLSDFVAGRPEAEALEVMTMFSSALEGCKLRSLNLSDNALGEKGIRAFSSLIKSQRELEELYLMNDGISEDAARAVRELLPCTDEIKVLQFHNNMTGDEGAIAIAEIVKLCPSLEDFRCSSTRIGSEGGVALAEALECCSHLKKLDLRDNMFGVEGGVALAKTLSVLNELTEIYMSYLNLEDEGTEALAEALIKSASPCLQVLELAGNDITVKSIGKLADCIAAKQSLMKLNLSENELKDDGTILIAKALEEGHEQLVEVDMSTNMMRRAGARALAQTVLKKDSFKVLNINGNFISEEGVDEVNEMFEDSPEKLGPLDDNDPEGEDFEDEEEEEGEEDNELEAKLGGLKIKQEET